MNVKFIVNDYILIWNLLFQASISESIYKLKQKLWINYKEEYNNTYRDKKLILKDPKNFIPNDDTIYNIVFETEEYKKLKKEVEKYRNNLMKLWDSNKKKINRLSKNIIKKEFEDYNIYIVNEELNVNELTEMQEQKIIIFGKKIDKEDPNKLLIDIILKIVKEEIQSKEDNEKLKKSIIELAVLNEFSTDLYEKSCYISGTPELESIKRSLYPYWLMYLGITKDEFESCMMRDRIEFNKNEYAYEKEILKFNLEQFIDFCARNIKYIIRNKNINL